MTTFSAQFLGCKISQTDVEAIRERLAEEGLDEVAGNGDLHVVNGCCVTAEAVAKTRHAVRRALAGGSAHVLVTGCAARLGDAGLAGIDPCVRVLGRAPEATPAAVAAALADLGCIGARPVPARRCRTRAFLRVQDGCSFACTFCVIPVVRGPSRSRPVAAVLEEARRRAREGYREVVLTGVNIGLYRDRADHDRRLPDVVRAVADVEGIDRIRLSSIEVQHVSDRLLAALAAEQKVLPHLHIPLQSGDDGILRAMRRRYPAAAYLERVAAARAAMPGLNLTGDVIVGFPGEDEQAFRATLAVVAAAGLTRAHVFPYSPRPGTRMAGADPVPPETKRDRSQRLRALAAAQGAAFLQARVGGRDEVLVEEIGDDGVATGYARDYTPWRVAGTSASPGEIVSAVATAAGPDGIEARQG